MMVQSKIIVKENDENGVAASKRRSTTMEVDHWAFLEEIEAPMWADLSLEPKLMMEDQDDSWFHTSHPFHQYSARNLRSAFAHPDEGNDLLNVNRHGTCSPQLPSSVSKSRGKDYRIRGWRSNFDQDSSNKAHPINDLGAKFSTLNAVSNRECKPKTNHSNPSEASCLTTGVVDDDSERRVGLNSCSTSTNVVSSRTITTVGLQQDSKILEVLGEGGHAGSLLNALRTNLRKSRATRPASRVEIKDDGESKGWKSSAGKSSVGSSTAEYDTESKGSAVVAETDQCKQVKSSATRPASRVEIIDDGESKGRKSSAGKSSVGSTAAYDTEAKGSAVVAETDQCKQVKSSATRPASRVEIIDDGESKGRKSSAGKSSVGSSTAAYDTEAKGSAVVAETDQCKQVKSHATRPASRVEVIGDGEFKGQKSSAGKSSVGSSTAAYDTKAKGSAVVAETDQWKQVKIEKNVNVGSNVQKTLFVRSNSGISNLKFGVKKMVDGSRQSKGKNPIVGDRTLLKKPINRVVKDKKMGEASVCTRKNALSSKIKGNIAAAARNNAYCSKIKANDASTRNNAYSSKIKANGASTKNISCSSRMKGNNAAAKSDSSSSKMKGNAAAAFDGSKMKGNSAASCSSKEASKSKVLLQTTQKCSLNQSKTGSKGAKGKLGSRQFNQPVCSGKENMKGKAVSTNTPGCKDSVPVVSISDHKVPKLKPKIKGVVISTTSKVRTGKMDEGFKSIDTRTHFR